MLREYKLHIYSSQTLLLGGKSQLRIKRLNSSFLSFLLYMLSLKRETIVDVMIVSTQSLLVYSFLPECI